MLQGDQSYMFWNKQVYKSQAAGASLSPNPNDNRLGVPLGRQGSAVSALSSEESSLEEEGDGGELRCTKCGGASFRARVQRGGGQRLECGRCGMLAY